MEKPFSDEVYQALMGADKAEREHYNEARLIDVVHRYRGLPNHDAKLANKLVADAEDLEQKARAVLEDDAGMQHLFERLMLREGKREVQLGHCVSYVKNVLNSWEARQTEYGIMQGKADELFFFVGYDRVLGARQLVNIVAPPLPELVLKGLGLTPEVFEASIVDAILTATKELKRRQMLHI